MGKAKKKAEGKYQQKPIDIRFIKLVEETLKKNKSNGIDPKSMNAMSIVLCGGSRETLGKIKAGQRGVTIQQLEIFNSLYGIDYEYLFQGGGISTTMVANDAVNTSGEGNVVITGGSRPKVSTSRDRNEHSGHVYNGDVHNNHIDKIVNMIPTEELRVQVEDAFNDLATQNSSLKEDIKKMSKLYKKQLAQLKQAAECEKEEKKQNNVKIFSSFRVKKLTKSHFLCF